MAALFGGAIHSVIIDALMGCSLQSASVRLMPVSAQGLSTTQLQVRLLSHNKAQCSSWPIECDVWITADIRSEC